MCMALSLIAGCNKLSDCSCEDQYVIVTKHGVKADGKTDVSDAIQKVIAIILTEPSFFLMECIYFPNP